MTPREQLLLRLAHGSVFNYFGLFVGTGFSKAAAGAAPSFLELLTSLVRYLNLPANIETDHVFHHLSFSQIASELERRLAATMDADLARLKLREAVSHICNLRPHPSVIG